MQDEQAGEPSKGLNATGPSPLQVGLRPLHALYMKSSASRLMSDKRSGHDVAVRNLSHYDPLGMDLDTMVG